jgi:uncharacterized protein
MTAADSPEFVETSIEGAPVRGFLHRADPTAPGLVLTHGAGANCRSLLLTSLAEAFASTGVTVLRCDLPFRQARPHGPPLRTAEKDQAGLKGAVSFLRTQTPGPIYLGGHSYGGRQATLLAASNPGLVEGLLLLSYPLHPPERPDQLRTQHFPDLRTPALFLHGTKDGFGSIAEIEAALKLIPVPTELLPISGAGHELISKRNRDVLTQQVIQTFRGMFLSDQAA